jgi:general secretion pathway protein A
LLVETTPKGHCVYRHFYNLAENPFKLAPDPAYHFRGRHQEEAIAHLQYAVTEGEGFIAISGDPGVGKTMACRMFVENLDDRAEAAYIFGPVGSPVELLKAINGELGLETTTDSLKRLTEDLNDYLMQKKVAGKRVAVFLDDAQSLSDEVLEQVRLLSNLETTRDKLLQIVLVGRPGLADTLASRELRQLGQRVSVAYHIGPLSREETAAYIQHRLSVASRVPGVRFDADAVRRIHRYSRGVPRNINIACDRALSAAFARKAKRVDGEIAAEAIAYLRGASRQPHERARLLRVLGWAAAGVLLLVAATAYYYDRSPDALEMPAAVPTSTPGSNSVEASRAAPPAETSPVSEMEPVPAASAALPAEEAVSEHVAPPGPSAENETANDPEAERTAAVQPPTEAPKAAKPPPPLEKTPPDGPKAPPKIEAASPDTTEPAPVYSHSVQVGAFLEEDNAERIASELVAKGYPARIVTISDLHNRTWHTVRIGDFPTREPALRRAAEFSAREQMDAAVRPYNAF